MPPPKAIVCHLCNGKYFKRSYPIHLKQCEAKWKKTHTRCEYCGSAVANHDWSDHRSHCKPTKKSKVSKHRRNMPLQVPKSDYQQIIPTLANNAKATECEECETENAVWKCLQCEQSLCAMCEVDLHRKGARSRHTRIPMNADALKQENLSKLINSECKDNELTPPKADPDHDPRSQCKFCSRRFNPERVEKHMRICSKAQKRKRRIYDGAKKRIEGTEFEAYQYNRSKTPEKVKEWKENGRRWRTESSQLREIASICSDLQATRDSNCDKKDEEPEIVIKAPSHKPAFKKASSTSAMAQVARVAPKSRMNRNVALKGSSMRMKHRPASNSSNYCSSESAKSVKRNVKRSSMVKTKERNQNMSNKPRASRRQFRGKKAAIPKFERKKSGASQVASTRAMKRGLVKTKANANKTAVIAKENMIETQPPTVVKRVRSEAKSLPRGLDLGVNVNKIFNDTPKTMSDYVERERLRRERRDKPSNDIKQSLNKRSKRMPKPSVVEKKQTTKKMTRVQMKKEIRIDNQPIGGRRASKPSNAKDLASQRAAYFESLLRNQE